MTGRKEPAPPEQVHADRRTRRRRARGDVERSAVADEFDRCARCGGPVDGLMTEDGLPVHGWCSRVPF